MLCSYCQSRPIKAKGYCGSCYSRYRKNGRPDKVKVKNSLPCEHCGKLGQHGQGLCSTCYARKLHHGGPEKIKVIAMGSCTHCGAHGRLLKSLCVPCYQRLRTTGSVEKTKVRKLRLCSSCGIETLNAIKGLCRKCYARLCRHGHTEQTRPKGWGDAERHPLYHTWGGMKSRCCNPNDKSYSIYGGRGISICERWLNFWNFVQDMGDKPSLNHSIDRIDTNGHYEPSNCRWATTSEQQRNRRNNVLNQERADEIRKQLALGKSIRDVADFLDESYDTVYNVKAKNTWSKD